MFYNSNFKFEFSFLNFSSTFREIFLAGENCYNSGNFQGTLNFRLGKSRKHASIACGQFFEKIVDIFV